MRRCEFAAVASASVWLFQIAISSKAPSKAFDVCGTRPSHKFFVLEWTVNEFVVVFWNEPFLYVLQTLPGSRTHIRLTQEPVPTLAPNDSPEIAHDVPVEET